MRIPTLLALTVILWASLPKDAAPQNACVGEVIMSFPLAATSAPAPVHLGRAFVLQALAGHGGWDLEVYRSRDKQRGDNLLAPIRNWHGAQAFQVTPYMAGIYPNERIIPIRSTASAICVRILNARIEGNEFEQRWVDGVVEVRWSRPHG